VVYSPDGKWIASADDFGTVKLWDAARAHGSVRRTLVHNDKGIDECAFSPDGKTLAVARAAQNETWLIEPITAEVQMRLTAATNASRVAYSADGSLLATGHYDGSVVLWDLQRGVSKLQFRVHNSWLDSLGLVGDNKRILAHGGHRWDAADGKGLGPLLLDGAPCTAWTLSPDRRTLVSSHASERVALWDVAVEKPYRILPTGGGHCLAISTDMKTLAIVQKNGTVEMWDHDGQAPVNVLQDGGDGFSCLVFSPDGRTLASTNRRCLALWHVPTGQEMMRLNGDFQDPCFSPDGQMLAVREGFRIVVLDAFPKAR
jgi:WD40 repeat protein